ncbi:MAG: ABC transporter permease [Chloroflexi bacterium]|nr:ABC transporter permease [Chloroflexota bacterium]MCH8194909.1 ABC transporter permease [Chloroflexota bacterium]MCI0769885.1 ABC transporter permease [Chloroflexota bacterium]
MTALAEVSFRSLHVWQRHRDVILRLWKTDIVPLLAEPVVILLVMGLGIGQVVDEVNGQDYLEFIGPGILAAYVMFAPAFENSWGSYVRMEVRRTYDAMIATPLSIEDVITGEILWGVTRSLFLGTLILIILAVMGIVKSPLAILVLPVAVLEGFLIASLAMAYTSKAPSINAFNFFYSLFIYPMFFLSGVFFPVEDLPNGLRQFAWVLPLTPAVHVMRHLITGDLVLSMVWSLLGMAGAAFGFYYLALVWMRRRLIR